MKKNTNEHQQAVFNDEILQLQQQELDNCDGIEPPCSAENSSYNGDGVEPPK